MADNFLINNDIFFGKNDLDSQDYFYSRMAYSVYAFRDHKEMKKKGVIRDFWFAENMLYGKVNSSFFAIEPKRRVLVPIAGAGDQFTFPFIAAAYAEFEKEIRNGILSGKIGNMPFLRKLKVHKSTESINQAYSGLSNIITNKIVRFLTRTRKADKILNFEEFMVHFSDFMLEHSTKNVITKSSFVMSSYIGLPHSGLSLELADAEYASDIEKVEDFISDPEYAYYLKVAEKYGFYVDKNAPWRLVANLSSRAMKLFIEDSGASGDLQSVLASNFKKAYTDDLGFLKFAAYNAYSTIVSSRPDISKTSQENGKLYTFFERRAPITPDEVDIIYPDERWLELYIRIKNNEKKLDFNEPEIKRIIKNSISLKNLLDTKEAMGYINRVFRDIPSLEGSFNDLQNRNFFKGIKDRPFSDYRNFLTRTAKIKKR